MQNPMPPALEAMLSAKAIRATDTTELRRILYADNRIGDAEASWLFRLNTGCAQKDASFTAFFVEALTDYIVFQVNPEGYINEANALWLMKQIDHDGKVDTAQELDLLINILEKAKSAPDGLCAYALRQVKDAVLHGEGVTRSGKQLKPGVVVEADVELLRRILYAYAGGGNIGITAAEAEVLFEIDEATPGSNNHPSWTDLFSKAIASHIMMFSGHTPVSREIALRRAAALETPEAKAAASGNPGKPEFVEMMVDGLRDIYAMLSGKDRSEQAKSFERLQAGITDSERVTESEARWLVNRINRDGKLSDAERAVLTFIKRESPDIHPALRPLLDKIA